MAEIHATAIIEGDVDLADDVVIGPHSVVTGPVTIGAGTRLIGGVWLRGPLSMGAGNLVYPGTQLGFPAQDLKWAHERVGAGVQIGDENTLREGVTIHGATSEEVPTRLGDRNYLMVATHLGHDCDVGSDCILSNLTSFAGHVRVDDRVVTGGAVNVHQFCRLGRGSMLSGGMSMGKDLPPYFTLTGNNICGSINIVGMRRSGMSSEDIATVKWVFGQLYRRGLPIAKAVEAISERAGEPLVDRYLAFFRDSRRGILSGRPSPMRQ